MSLEEFKNIVLPVKNKLYRFALSIVGDPAEAQDIVQEVLIKLWQGRHEASRINNLEAWCMRLTKNLSIDKLRSKHKRTNPIEEAYSLYSDAADPHQVTEYEDTLLTVKKLMERLPAQQKLIMQLRDIEEMSYQEISETLGLTMSQVKVNLFRARQQVRASLLKSESYGL